MDRFQFHWVPEEIVVDKGLNGWVVEEVLIVDNEAVVNVTVVSNVQVCVLQEVVVDPVPGVFNEGDGDIAEGWRELGANPSSSDLFVSVIASPENAGVECISDDSGDVGGLDGALCGVFLVVSADVGVVEGIAGGLNIHSESVGGLLLLPVLYHGVDCIDQSVLGDRVEEAHQVVVGSVEGDVCRCLSEVAVEVVP